MISVSNLEFTYPQATTSTLKGLSFSIGRGEIFGFLGPSGAGKSTTQSILTRQIKSGFSGHVAVMDKPISNWNSDYFNHIGVCFELPNHYEKLTALENLRFFASFYTRDDADLESLLDTVGLLDAKDRQVAQFSKGMKMRLNFARSILHDPSILFLDEPTSGLDPATARRIKDVIQDLKARGKTIFLTTHNMHDADELCDQVAFITDGEIKLIDSPRKLKLDHGDKHLRLEYMRGGKLQRETFPMTGLAENPLFQQRLKEENIETIHSSEATLEDIFLNVTGVRLQ